MTALHGAISNTLLLLMVVCLGWSAIGLVTGRGVSPGLRGTVIIALGVAIAQTALGALLVLAEGRPFSAIHALYGLSVIAALAGAIIYGGRAVAGVGGDPAHGGGADQHLREREAEQARGPGQALRVQPGGDEGRAVGIESTVHIGMQLIVGRVGEQGLDGHRKAFNEGTDGLSSCSARKACRARDSRDITVPIGMPSVSAASR